MDSLAGKERKRGRGEEENRRRMEELSWWNKREREVCRQWGRVLILIS
jgi:hypothetical protein